MALFDFLKKKRSKSDFEPVIGPPPGPPMSSPIERIQEMQQQGMPNDQIVAILQREGYSQSQIYDALNQVAVKRSVEPSQPPTQELRETPEPKENMQEKVEELVESVIDEKWEVVEKKLTKLREEKEESEKRFVQLKQEVKDLRADIDNLHKAIISKISEYDKNLLDVGTEIKAMEKVFQKILPDLTKNVHDISKAAEKLKRS